jgi:integrase
MALTVFDVRNAKPKPKPYRMYDSGGLYLQVQPGGGRHWRFKYYWPAGKERLMSLGSYPEMSLADARRRRDEARLKLHDNIDPVAHKTAAAASSSADHANSLEAVSREWISQVHQFEVVPEHSQRNLRRLELHVFPSLGKRPIRDIEPQEIATCLRRLLSAGKHATVEKVRPLLSQIFRFAIASKRATRDAARDAAALLPKYDRKEEKHFAAATSPDEVRRVLTLIDGYRGFPPTIAGIKLATMLFPRPGKLASMKWADLNLAAQTWDYDPGKLMPPMLVPLPRQATLILNEMWALRRAESPYVFPGHRNPKRPMTTAAMSNAMLELGLRDDQKVHGFRATARTILVERLGISEPVVEMQLGHAVKDGNGRAYNRTTWLEQRREMLQMWADFLDDLRARSL